MTCADVQRAMQDGTTLSPAMDAHVAGCSDCASLAAVDALLRDWPSEAPMPAAMVSDIMAAVAAVPVRRPAWSWEWAAVFVVLAGTVFTLSGSWSVSFAPVWDYFALVGRAFVQVVEPLRDVGTWSPPPLSVPASQSLLALATTMAGLCYLNVRWARP